MGCISKPRPTLILHLDGGVYFNFSWPILNYREFLPVLCITFWMTCRRNPYMSTVLQAVLFVASPTCGFFGKSGYFCQYEYHLPLSICSFWEKHPSFFFWIRWNWTNHQYETVGHGFGVFPNNPLAGISPGFDWWEIHRLNPGTFSIFQPATC